MRLLLISNSTNAGEEYLDYPKNNIKEFLGTKKTKCIFIPYAAVSFSYDEYEEKVKTRFNEIGHDLISIHKFDNKIKAIKEADAIVIGGGNTFHLLKTLQDENLIEPIKARVKENIPYIGWSAGSNMACPTIRTTNDMPVVEPDSFNAIGLIDFQINPHYLDANPDGHAGETREQRINEFLVANKTTKVFGLRESSMLLCEDGNVTLIGTRKGIIFEYNKKNIDIDINQEISSLLK